MKALIVYDSVYGNTEQIAWLLLLPGSIILDYSFGVNDPNLIYTFTFSAFGFLVLTIFAGFAPDSQRQTDLHQTASIY